MQALCKKNNFILICATVLLSIVIANVSILITPSCAEGITEADVAAANAGAEEWDLLGWLTGKAKEIGMAVVTVPLLMLRKLTAIFMVVAMSTLDLMLSDAMYEGVFFSDFAIEALNTGWGLVRDFVNMFYILILIFLAIATILRVNKFSDKKLLIAVVISALLVNFSKPIALFIIDVSNLAMNFFMGGIVRAHMSYSSLMADKVNLSSLFAKNSILNEEGGLLLLMTEIIFSTIFAIALFVLAIALLMRLVAFWVLIVLSPLAFFGLALPGTFVGSLFKSWLEKMAYWAFFGPVLLFFLWLAIVLVEALAVSKAASGIPNINVTPVSVGEGEKSFAIDFFKNIIPFIGTIYFLFYGFDLSKKIAAKAGSSVGGLMQKGQGWMNKGLKYSAVAGTGAVGAAGYVGYKYGKGVAEDAAAAGKKKLESTKYGGLLTKKGREGKRAERQAHWTGKGEEFERDKSNESYKKMKDAGMTKEEVAKGLTSGNKHAAAGSAKLMAEKGWLDNPDQYRQAMAAAGNVKGMKNQVENLAKKKNLNSVINYELDQKARELGHADSAELAKENWVETEKVLKEHTKDKGVADFAEQDIGFFKNNLIRKHLKKKYAGVTPDVREAARKKATDKISDPEKLQKMLDIVGETKTVEEVPFTTA